MQLKLYYDFANPTSQVGDASIRASNQMAPGSDGQSYEREHIYELQSGPCCPCFVSRILLMPCFIVAAFINQFQLDSNLKTLWNVAQTSDFCHWVNDQITSNPVTLKLVACLPYNGERKYMPQLNVSVHLFVPRSMFDQYPRAS